MTDPSVPGRDASRDVVDTLLTQVAGGDRQAFEALYRTTSGSLLGICLRVLADRADAEDVLQEVYVTIWSKAAQFDAARSSAMTWLGSIARNRSIDRLRTIPTPASRVAIEVAEAVHDETPSPAAGAEAAAQREHLDRCLEQLEPNRQTLIRTAFFDGATYEELATRSGSPLGTVKSWIRRGLLQLKACLEQ
jgi:RNA polymerase sigma-70 factor (ECF subfamily)